MQNQIKIGNQNDVWGYLNETFLPLNSLLLGVADDNLPVLLDTDSHHKILVEDGRDVLKCMVASLIHKNADDETYMVITSNPRAWNLKYSSGNLDDISHGIIQLSKLVHDRRLNKKVFLFVDGLDFFIDNLDYDSKMALKYLVLRHGHGIYVNASGDPRGIWGDGFVSVICENGKYAMLDGRDVIFFSPLTTDF